MFVALLVDVDPAPVHNSKTVSQATVETEKLHLEAHVPVAVSSRLLVLGTCFLLFS